MASPGWRWPLLSFLFLFFSVSLSVRHDGNGNQNGHDGHGAQPFEGPSNAQSFEKGSSNAQPFNNGLSNAQPFDKGQSNARPFNKGPSDGQRFNNGPSTTQASDKRPSNARPFNDGPSKVQPSDKGPTTRPPTGNDDAQVALKADASKYITDLFSAVSPEPLFETCTSSAWSEFSAWSTTSFNPADVPRPTFTFTPVSPCCGQCYVTAPGKIELAHWPTPAIEPGVTAVTSGSFTFTSPSQYLIFTSLYASNACGTQGSHVTSATLGFSPGQLSSILKLVSGLGTDITTMMNFADFSTDCATLQDIGTELDKYYTINGNVYHDRRCFPNIQVPPAAVALNTEWATCTGFLPGAYDPPIVLTTAGSPLQVPTPDPSPDPHPTKADPPAPPPTTKPSPAPTPKPPSPTTTTRILPIDPAEAPVIAFSSMRSLIVEHPIAAPTSADPGAPDPSPTPEDIEHPSPQDLFTTSKHPASVNPGAAPAPSSSSTQGVGDIIMSVFNPPVPSSPTPTPTPKPNKPKTIHPSKTQKPHQISLPIASVTASFLPSAGVIIASETLAPNGPAVIVNGTPVRVDKSGNIIVAPTSVSALVVGDSTIKKGGEGITVDRTVISVGSDGRVGSSVVSSSSSTDGGVTSQSDTSIPGDGTTSVPPDEATSSVASDRNVPTPTSPNGIPSTTGPGYLDPLGTDGAIIAGKASSIKSGGILLCICIGMRAILLIG